MTIRSAHFPFHLRVEGKIIRMRDTVKRPLVLSEVWKSDPVETFGYICQDSSDPIPSERRTKSKRRSKR